MESLTPVSTPPVVAARTPNAQPSRRGGSRPPGRPGASVRAQRPARQWWCFGLSCGGGAALSERESAWRCSRCSRCCGGGGAPSCAAAGCSPSPLAQGARSDKLKLNRKRSCAVVPLCTALRPRPRTRGSGFRAPRVRVSTPPRGRGLAASPPLRPVAVTWEGRPPRGPQPANKGRGAARGAGPVEE